jgi:hypothetical protein
MFKELIGAAKVRVKVGSEKAFFKNYYPVNIPFLLRVINQYPAPKNPLTFL